MATNPLTDPLTYNVIDLSIDIENTFNLCRLQSLYAGSGVVSASGETQESMFALTASERDFFDLTLKQAAAKVYDAISQDTKLATDPIQYNVFDTATNKQVIKYQMWAHADWDANQLFGLHTAVVTALVSYVLKEWYKIRSASTLFQVADANYTSQIADVKILLNRRITPAKTIYRYHG